MLSRGEAIAWLAARPRIARRPASGHRRLVPVPGGPGRALSRPSTPPRRAQAELGAGGGRRSLGARQSGAGGETSLIRSLQRPRPATGDATGSPPACADLLRAVRPDGRPQTARRVAWACSLGADAGIDRAGTCSLGREGGRGRRLRIPRLPHDPRGLPSSATVSSTPPSDAVRARRSTCSGTGHGPRVALAGAGPSPPGKRRRGPPLPGPGDQWTEQHKEDAPFLKPPWPDRLEMEILRRKARGVAPGEFRIVGSMTTGPLGRGVRRGSLRPRGRRRRSGGSRGRRSGRSASRGRGPAGAGSWRAGRGCGPCPRRRSSRSRRSRRSAMPPLTPPPASHIVKPCGLWSRPSLALRDRRAAELAAPEHQRVLRAGRAASGRVSRPAIGLSTSLAFLRRGRPSGCRAGPTCRCASTSMNRTPASANRRASRHCRPKSSVGFVVDAVELQRRLRLARAGPSASAPPPACGRPARTTRSRLRARSSPPAASRCSRFIACSRSSCCRCWSRRAAAGSRCCGSRRWSAGVPASPIGVPW